MSLLVGAAATPSPCNSDHIATLRGGTQGTAGHAHYTVVFRNGGTAPCTLRGYPGVSSASAVRGHQVGSSAARNNSVPVRTITLKARGGKAHADLAQVDVGVLDRQKCKPVRAKGIRVFAPNQTRSAYVPLSHMACSAKYAHDSTITAVSAGAGPA